ncbi:hypothetical protein D1007_26890 [Hordeum vulgare]|nr:hypothetical protein D1007_26890 [Hordeum vulgare]
MAAPAIPLHIHALLAGVLPPFSSFLVVVLSHYQIHALHLDPRPVVLLLAFAFLCEAFVGITSSVALLHHFFSLELVSKQQCSGCASLKVGDALAPWALGAVHHPEAEGFRRQWVLGKVTEVGTMFRRSSTPATPNQEWTRCDLSDSQFAPVLTQLEELKRVGVTMAMVVQEFICRRIAPLQHHSCLMWTFRGPRDPMRIQVWPHPPDVLCELLRRLTGGDPDELPLNGLPVYKFKAPKALIAEMPLFDEWGFLPGREARPRGASAFGVQAFVSSSRAAPSTASASGVLPPASPTLAPGRAGACGGDRLMEEVAVSISKLRSRVVGPPRQVPHVGRKRRSLEDDCPSTRWALVKRKWVTVDE